MKVDWEVTKVEKVVVEEQPVIRLELSEEDAKRLLALIDFPDWESQGADMENWLTNFYVALDAYVASWVVARDCFKSSKTSFVA